MFNILKTLFDPPHSVSRTDTTVDSPDPRPDDVWAFSDPDALDEYDRRGQTRQLEHDIRFEVMRAGSWQAEELGYKSAIRRLLRDGTIADKGTYWYRSPHPTVYRAQRDGSVTIEEWNYHFYAGDDLTFQCRMERDLAKEDPGPLLVARLNPTEKAVLCGDMSSAMRKLTGRMSGME